MFSKEKRVSKIDKTIRKNIQDTIPFISIIKDGIFENEPGVYSRSYSISDINYQIAKESEQQEMFFKYCTFLNTFDNTTHIEITINNKNIDIEQFKKQTLLHEKGDKLDELRNEYNERLLLEKIKEGKNSMVRDRYFTLTIQSDNEDTAISTFQRLDGEVIAGVKKIGGAEATPLSTSARLQILHDIYNIGKEDDFDSENFDYNKVLEAGLSAKDYIAPYSFEFEKDYIKVGDKFVRVVYLKDIPSIIQDNVLADLTNTTYNTLTTVNVQGLTQEKSMKLVRNQLTNIEANVVDAQKSASKGGYSADLIPSSLKQAHSEAQELLSDLTERNQKMFLVTITVAVFADNLKKLDANTEEVISIGRKHLCSIKRLNYQQEAAFNATMPFGVCKLCVDWSLTTESTAIWMPFASQELCQKNGMYYGLNAVSHNLVLYNRTNSKNSNGMILGTPGSGKSFSAKREMLNVLLNSDDDVVVIDPEGEYAAMAGLLGGEVVKIKTGGNVFINPMDMDEAYSTESDPLAMKSDFIVSLCETVIGGHYGLDAIQNSIIDRCVRKIYEPYKASGYQFDKTPTLLDFQRLLKQQEDPEARNIALSLELYTEGSLNIFAHQTNVNTKNRFVVYDVKDIGGNVKTMGIQIVLDSIWNQICKNRNRGRKTWFYVDEIYLLFANKSSAVYLQQLWKRARKWGGVPTGITQNVEDLLQSETACTMLSNSDFIMMLNQASLDRDKLASLLNISDTQLSYITNADPGQGLIYVGGSAAGQGGIIPFVDRFPQDTKMFKAMNTQLSAQNVSEE